MSRIIGVVALCFFAQNLWASDQWEFQADIQISGPAVAGQYHHLEGAGRKHIALSEQTVAASWEDNRTGDPQVYVAFKHLNKTEFNHELQLSSGSEAYEPSIAALHDNQFVVVWEQDAAVYLALLQNQKVLQRIQMSKGNASHASVASFDGQVYVSWREQNQRLWHISVARLEQKNDSSLQLVSSQRIESEGLNKAVLFPVVVANAAGLAVAWEDRRAGNTRLLFSYSSDQAFTFSEPQYLNEFFSNRNEYDKGNGVTRVSLASFAEDEVIGVWMDKRRSAGYGIFAALGSDGGESFGPNEKVHSLKGDLAPHYNPAASGNLQGDFVVAWDDYREGNSDVWLSTFDQDEEEWTLDFSPSVSSGPGEQSHPTVALDEQGGLHMIWLDKPEPNAATQLLYSYGVLKEQY